VKRPTAAVRRAAAGGLAAVPVAVAGMSWHVLVALVLALLIVVAAGCWAIADNGRARRLALLIRSCRSGPGAPLTRGSLARADRQRPAGWNR